MCLLAGENASYKFHFINGQEEIVESDFEYTEDLMEKVHLITRKEQKWVWIKGKVYNLSNVISIEVVGEKDKPKLVKIELNND